jgi:CheY-like chemotaxis protein
MSQNQTMGILMPERQCVAPEKPDQRPNNNESLRIERSRDPGLAAFASFPNDDFWQTRQSKPVNNNFGKPEIASAFRNKVLVIDDDPFWSRALKIRLEASHYDACFAADGESGIKVARAEKPDLIILDLGLPRGDGYFVIKSLNKFRDLARVPIIVLTARDGAVHEGRCIRAGAKRFFEKPAHNHHLLRAIRDLMH